MSKRPIPYLFVIFCCLFSFTATAAAQQADKYTEKVRTKAIDNGAGPRAKVRVELFYGRAFKGYTDSITGDKMVIIVDRLNTPVVVQFADIKKFEGRNTSRIHKKALAIGGMVAFLIAGGVILNKE